MTQLKLSVCVCVYIYTSEHKQAILSSDFIQHKQCISD